MASSGNQSLEDAIWVARTRRIGSGDSEYGLPTGSHPVTGSAPVPGKTDPAELREPVTMSKRAMPRPFVES